MTISPTLVETYVTAATKIARIAAGYWRMRVQTQHYCSDKASIRCINAKFSALSPRGL